ncbi:unnamed protein product [Cylindrotheca closterium]|uniref:Uncharacterized protein n=1 Tax=Cylindrotheca closterium TaxID=2856 RepID=A0AAD2FH34_9STRA|nr:unnamed protein product [Cylindrotheca closterium]
MADFTPALTIKECLARFDDLPQVGNPPTYKEVNASDIANQRNTAKFPSPNGGGQLCHVGLTMTAPDYALISPSYAWVNPSNFEDRHLIVTGDVLTADMLISFFKQVDMEFLRCRDENGQRT